MLKVAISRIPLRVTGVVVVKHIKYCKRQESATLNICISTCKTLSTTTKQPFNLTNNYVSRRQE